MWLSGKNRKMSSPRHCWQPAGKKGIRTGQKPRSKSDEYTRNGLRWCKIKDGVRDSRKMTGKDFGTGIYQRFGLNRGYRYKVRGSIALRESENDEYLLVFNMLEVDPFPMTTKARENAGVLKEELDEESLTELRYNDEKFNTIHGELTTIVGKSKRRENARSIIWMYK